MKYYLDTEFDGFKGPLISIALVREDSGYYYATTNHNPTDEWVQANVMPIRYNVLPAYSVPLPVPSVRRARFSEKYITRDIAAFFGMDSTPIEIIADWPDDIKYLCELLITGPGKMIAIPGISFKVERVDAYPTDMPGAVQHNAFWDAMALRYYFTGKAHDVP